MNNDTSDETPATLIVVLIALALWPIEHIYYGLWTLPGVWIGWAVVAFFCYQLFRRKSWAWWVLTLLFSLVFVGNFYDYFWVTRDNRDFAGILFQGLNLFIPSVLVFSSIRPWALKNR